MTEYYAYVVKRNPIEQYQIIIDRTKKGIPVVTDKDLGEKTLRRVLNIGQRLEDAVLIDITPLIETGIISRDKLRVLG